MRKKNPYVTTIGFNKDDPEHRIAAELLNDMGRGKAAYIAKAILSYKRWKENGEILQTGFGMDYEGLRSFVLKIISENSEKDETALVSEGELENKIFQKREENPIHQIGFDESDIQNILQSMDSFRG